MASYSASIYSLSSESSDSSESTPLTPLSPNTDEPNPAGKQVSSIPFFKNLDLRIPQSPSDSEGNSNSPLPELENTTPPFSPETDFSPPPLEKLHLIIPRASSGESNSSSNSILSKSEKTYKSILPKPKTTTPPIHPEDNFHNLLTPHETAQNAIQKSCVDGKLRHYFHLTNEEIALLNRRNSLEIYYEERWIASQSQSRNTDTNPSNKEETVKFRENVRGGLSFDEDDEEEEEWFRTEVDDDNTPKKPYLNPDDSFELIPSSATSHPPPTTREPQPSNPSPTTNSNHPSPSPPPPLPFGNPHLLNQAKKTLILKSQFRANKEFMPQGTDVEFGLNWKGKDQNEKEKNQKEKDEGRHEARKNKVLARVKGLGTPWFKKQVVEV